jgi:hypothetical protein
LSPFVSPFPFPHFRLSDVDSKGYLPHLESAKPRLGLHIFDFIAFDVDPNFLDYLRNQSANIAKLRIQQIENIVHRISLTFALNSFFSLDEPFSEVLALALSFLFISHWKSRNPMNL